MDNEHLKKVLKGLDGTPLEMKHLKKGDIFNLNKKNGEIASIDGVEVKFKAVCDAYLNDHNIWTVEIEVVGA